MAPGRENNKQTPKEMLDGNGELTLIIIFVFVLAFAVRLGAALRTDMINSDGVLYIHQARILSTGTTNGIIGCGISFLSVYPFLIAGFHSILDDWILSARAVSFLFGACTFIPLYFLLKQFFEREVAVLTTAIYTLVPVFVGRSVDVVRGPVCWFFLVTGLFFFVYRMKRENRLFLVLSSLFFLIAAWARIESILFLIVSDVFLLRNRENRIRNLVWFNFPLILLLAAVLISPADSSLSPERILRFEDIIRKITFAPLDQYHRLQDQIDGLQSQVTQTPVRHFLPEARNFAWLVALGTLANRTMEGFFYPLFFLVLAGIGDVIRRRKTDSSIGYLLSLIMAGYLLLYVHLIHKWILHYRFFGIVIFPACIAAGFGFIRLTGWLQRKTNRRRRTVFFWVLILVVACHLPKNLKARYDDKTVFQKIGEYISQTARSDQGILISTSTHTHRWIHFFANRNVEPPFCPQQFSYCYEYLPDDYDAFIETLMNAGATFLLWEEKNWPPGKFSRKKIFQDPAFQRLRTFSHPDTGEMVLFRIRTNPK
jgi:hypothetical protein